MNQPAPLSAGLVLKPADQRGLGLVAGLFRIATLAGLGAFGVYIVLRATGATYANFAQWRPLLSGQPLTTASDWVANLGIGMHFLMGAVLVLAWPILLSARIRTRHRVLHRWTGRVYVTAGLLAGIGGMSYIVTHGAFSPAASVAFAIWGAIMMTCSILAFVYARARRFDLHRAWAIRLFATVLGSWLFDVEIQAWKHVAGGVGMHPDGMSGPFDYVILYLFFVPNLLVAELFIRNVHKRPVLQRNLLWPVVAASAAAGAIFVYATVLLSATHAGKVGKHLLPLLGFAT